LLTSCGVYFIISADAARIRGILIQQDYAICNSGQTLVIRYVEDPSGELANMKTRKLGSSDLNITPIGIGAWAIGGGKWEFGWGAQDDKDSIAAIHEGLNRGMNWIDTAAVYGLGHSEEVVGRAIQGLKIRPYVFTKCSLVWDSAGKITHNLLAASIRREAEASLKRLQMESIDLYQIHWPAWRGHPEGDSPGSIEEAIGTMGQLQREGKIRHIGLSNFDPGQIKRAQAIAPIVCLQPKYSLLARDIEKTILPYALQEEMGVIVYSPMASGMLSGAMTLDRIARLPEDDWRKNTPNFKEPLLSQNLQLVERLKEIGKRHGRSAGETAIAWTLRNPAVTGAIVGTRSAEQVRGVIGAAELKLTGADMAEIESALALRASA
jgi:aryl-alcohol dehydrogenase-like predicted oxidoreductase